MIDIIEENSKEYIRQILNAIFEDPNSFIGILDRDGSVKRINKTALDFIGKNKNELIGKKFWKTPWWNHSEELQKTLKEKIGNVSKGNFERFEGIHYGKDGKKIHVDVSIRPVFNDSNKVNDIIVEGKDITESKKTESELKNSKRKIEELHKIAAEIESTDDKDEIFEITIQAAKKILSMESCEIMIKEGDMFKVKAHSVYIEGVEPLDMDIDEGIAGKTYENQKSYLVSNIPQNEETSPSYSSYRSGISIPIGKFGVFQALSTEFDYFDEKDLELAELLISYVKSALENIRSHEKERFLLTLLRHDLRNKTQIIRGYLDMLKSADFIKEKREEILNKTLNSVVESQELIDKVGLIKDINKEKERSVDLDLAVSSAIDSYRSLLDERNIEIKKSIADYRVNGGPMLEEVFKNIIENCIKHSGCSKIRISSKDKNGKIIVTIEDDGIGISKDHKNKILKKGFKGKESKGLGIGLYLVKNIIENYRGFVDVKDSELGGARFDISLNKA